MPKKPINSQIDSPLSNSVGDAPAPTHKDVPALAEKAIFSPSVSMKKVKARFWLRYQPGPFTSPSSINAAEIARLTGSTGIKDWWGKPGFKDWFLNKDEQKEKLHYLFDKSLASLEQILDNPDANPGAKINAIKMLAEMTGHLGKKPEQKFADESIEQMSESQLLEFIKKNSIKLVEEKIIETKANKPREED